jgi:hypothetical protein
MSLENIEFASRLEESVDDLRPTGHVVHPAESSATGVHEIGGAVEFVWCVQDIASIPRRRGLEGVGFSARDLDHAVADVHADDLVGAEIPEGQGVRSPRALEVDGSVAPLVEVFQVVELGADEVRASLTKEFNSLSEFALIVLRTLVPSSAVVFVESPRVHLWDGTRPTG